MPEDQIKELTRKFDEFSGQFIKEFYELKGEINANKPHETPCSLLCEHMKKHSDEVARLHDKQDEHVKEHHSPKTARANWGLIFNAICSLATLGTLIYVMKG